jgi:hypothetical protein
MKFKLPRRQKCNPAIYNTPLSEVKTNFLIHEELRNNIHHDISTTSREELQRVNNMLRRYTEWIPSGQQHFPHLL